MSEAEPLPPWCDSALNAQLHLLVAAGETQAVEFKARLPKHFGDLGKEIAAFATSNAGMILLGVANDGSIIGLEGAAERAARQALVDRIEGLCAQTVKPSITPHLRFACVDSRVVAAIGVPKGGAPVYYSANIPYLRQLTAARPMSPDEVIEAILAWDRARQPAEPNRKDAYLSGLATLLINVIVHVRELEEREVDPWLRETRYYLAACANEARSLAAQASDEVTGTVEPLRRMAEHLETAAHERLLMGEGFAEMYEAARLAESEAKAIQERWLPPEAFNHENISEMLNTVATIGRKQADLTSRIEGLIDRCQTDDLCSEAAANGLMLRRAATSLQFFGQQDRGSALDAIGARLCEIQTRQIYIDGGASERAIANDLNEANEDLQQWIAAQ